MSRPRISTHTRKLWRAYPLMRVGVTFPAKQMHAIRFAMDNGATYHAQQLILSELRRELDGPRTVARWRNGRKILSAA